MSMLKHTQTFNLPTKESAQEFMWMANNSTWDNNHFEVISFSPCTLFPSAPEAYTVEVSSKTKSHFLFLEGIKNYLWHKFNSENA